MFHCSIGVRDKISYGFYDDNQVDGAHSVCVNSPKFLQKKGVPRTRNLNGNMLIPH